MNAIGKWLLSQATAYVVGVVVDSTVEIVVPMVRLVVNNIKAEKQGHPGYVEVEEKDPLTQGMAKYVNKSA